MTELQLRAGAQQPPAGTPTATASVPTGAGPAPTATGTAPTGTGVVRPPVGVARGRASVLPAGSRAAQHRGPAAVVRDAPVVPAHRPVPPPPARSATAPPATVPPPPASPVAGLPVPAAPAAGSGPAAAPAAGQPSRAGTATGWVVAWTGLAVAAMSGALSVMPDGGGALRVAAAVGFACLGPGAAVLSHRWSRDPVVTWALVVVVSLAGYAATATVMAWAGWWRPGTVSAVASGAVALSCFAALVRLALRPAPPAAAATAPDRPVPAGTDRRPWAALAAHGAVLAAGVGLWRVAVAGTDETSIGEFGLLATVHPAYFTALLLCVAGFVAALRRTGRWQSLPLGGYLLLLVLVLHGTTPALLDQVQYAWTYKHVGVVEFLREAGGVADASDIYQQWPALFAAVALLADVSGVAPLGLAAWSPVFFNVAGSLVLLAVARSLTRDPRVGYLTVFLFQAVNWVEEDYLAPQALAFLLALAAQLVLVRWLRGPGIGRRVVTRPAGPAPEPARTDPVPAARRVRLAGWLTRGLPAPPDVSGRQRAAAVVGVTLLFAVLTAAHQLSPYLVVAQVSALIVLGLVRPWWTAPLLGVVVVGYLVPRFGMISGSFGMFDGFDIFGNAAGNAESWGSLGQAVSATVVRTLALSVWALAALAVLRARRRPGRVLLPAVLAGTPFVLLAMQSYGGEAIYRVFLFSAPWCAYLIADLVLRRRAGAATGPGPRRARRWALAALAVLALAAATLGTAQGRHGQLYVDRQTAAEVDAARHLYAHGKPGATVALVTPNFPSRLSGNYGQFNRSVPVGEPDLVKGAQLRHVHLNDAQLPVIEKYLRTFRGTTTYLVVSDGMRRQAGYFGYLPDGSLDVLEETIAQSPRWKEFYRNSDVVIYRFRG